MYCVRDYIINGFNIKLSVAIDYTVSLSCVRVCVCVCVRACVCVSGSVFNVPA